MRIDNFEAYEKMIRFQSNMWKEELNNALADKKVCVLAMIKRRIDAGMPEEQAIKEATAIGKCLFDEWIKTIENCLLYGFSD